MKNIFLVSILMLPIFAFSDIGNDQGNGGDGLWINNKLYVLDLVEAGVETNPHFSTSVPVRPNYKKRLERVFDTALVPTQLLAQKLSEIATVDRVTAEGLLITIELYVWRWVNSELVDINDEDSSLNYPRKNSVQLAVRRDQGIKVNREAWSNLNDGNRVALILHEAVYALIKPDGNRQSSPQAREINGYFFSRDLLSREPADLHKLTKGFLPSHFSFYSVYVSDVPFTTKERSVIGNPYMIFSRGEEELPWKQSEGYYRNKAELYCSKVKGLPYAYIRARYSELKLNFSPIPHSASNTYLKADGLYDGSLETIDLPVELKKEACTKFMTNAFLELNRKLIVLFEN